MSAVARLVTPGAPDAETLFIRIERIGKGSFGEVYKGVNKLTNEVVAIKVLDLDTDDDEITDVQKEITMLSHCDSEHITRYHGSYLHGTKLWVVMDYAAGGSMRHILKSGPIEERFIAIIAREVLYALVYLHKSAGIIHRDIKAANILLTDEGKVKLCDFGVAGQITMSCLRRNSFVGTPYWMAPEIIKRAQYDFKADIWSLGITIIELATGNPPFADQDPRRAIFLIPRTRPAKLEGKYSVAMKEFIAMCLKEEPEERPTAEELLKSKFIKSAANRGASALQDLLMRHQLWKEQHQNDSDDEPFLGTMESDEGELASDDEWVFETVKESPTKSSSTSVPTTPSTAATSKASSSKRTPPTQHQPPSQSDRNDREPLLSSDGGDAPSSTLSSSPSAPQSGTFTPRLANGSPPAVMTDWGSELVATINQTLSSTSTMSPSSNQIHSNPNTIRPSNVSATALPNSNPGTIIPPRDPSVTGGVVNGTAVPGGRTKRPSVLYDDVFNNYHAQDSDEDAGSGSFRGVVHGSSASSSPSSSSPSLNGGDATRQRLGRSTTVSVTTGSSPPRLQLQQQQQPQQSQTGAPFLPQRSVTLRDRRDLSLPRMGADRERVGAAPVPLSQELEQYQQQQLLLQRAKPAVGTGVPLARTSSLKIPPHQNGNGSANAGNGPSLLMGIVSGSATGPSKGLHGLSNSYDEALMKTVREKERERQNVDGGGGVAGTRGPATAGPVSSPSLGASGGGGSGATTASAGNGPVMTKPPVPPSSAGEARRPGAVGVFTGNPAFNAFQASIQAGGGGSFSSGNTGSGNPVNGSSGSALPSRVKVIGKESSSHSRSNSESEGEGHGGSRQGRTTPTPATVTTMGRSPNLGSEERLASTTNGILGRGSPPLAPTQVFASSSTSGTPSTPSSSPSLSGTTSGSQQPTTPPSMNRSQSSGKPPAPLSSSPSSSSSPQQPQQQGSGAGQGSGGTLSRSSSSPSSYFRSKKPGETTISTAPPTTKTRQPQQQQPGQQPQRIVVATRSKSLGGGGRGEGGGPLSAGGVLGSPIVTTPVSASASPVRRAASSPWEQKRRPQASRKGGYAMYASSATRRLNTSDATRQQHYPPGSPSASPSSATSSFSSYASYYAIPNASNSNSTPTSNSTTSSTTTTTRSRLSYYRWGAGGGGHPRQLAQQQHPWPLLPPLDMSTCSMDRESLIEELSLRAAEGFRLLEVLERVVAML
ncbi:Serine/threonine-protein kinase 25 [Quaeritorhiza haematococci]|nr:Serine/threonine-protein kinase 25 [Quaeritorhiza haematococci]